MEIRVFAPASVANVGVGFDILGFALEAPGDEIVARFGNCRGVRIREITGTSRLPLEASKNTASFSAQALLDYLGKGELGIELDIHKKMPFGSGLGSSAASAVGGVFAVNALLGSPLSRRQMLPFAVLGEQIADGAYHADNVAPSLLGGMVLIRDNRELDIIELPVPDELYAAVVYPEMEVLTQASRGILSPEVPLANCISQTGNLGGFIAGLYRSDYALLGRTLRDHIIEPQRAGLIPSFPAVKAQALASQALGCSISGAGPSVFALFLGKEAAQKGGDGMQEVFKKAGMLSTVFISRVGANGAHLLPNP